MRGFMDWPDWQKSPLGQKQIQTERVGMLSLRRIHNNSVSLPIHTYSTMIDDPRGLEQLMLSIEAVG